MDVSTHRRHVRWTTVGTGAAMSLLIAIIGLSSRSSLQAAPPRVVGATFAAAPPCPRARVVLVGHRGTGPGTRLIDGRFYTEDTLPAFRKAMALGADGFETDYWLTLDAHVVSNHDATLDRTTDGSGLIRSRLWEYVRALRTGSGATVPGLSRVERTMQGYGGLRQQEIKDGAEFSRAQLTWLLKLDRRYVPARHVLITSSEMRTLSRVHAIDPAIGTGLITRRSTARPSMSLLPAWLDVVLIDLRAADATYAEKVHAALHLLSVRNVDTVTDLHRAVALGADRVLTDFPERLARAC
jgi:glycerophosphoryl diester phosphodiesterase